MINLFLKIPDLFKIIKVTVISCLTSISLNASIKIKPGCLSKQETEYIFVLLFSFSNRKHLFNKAKQTSYSFLG